MALIERHIFNQRSLFQNVVLVTLKTRTQSPCARVFAVYNANSANQVPFLVDGKLGGSNKLILDNMSSYNREIRQKGSMR